MLDRLVHRQDSRWEFDRQLIQKILGDDFGITVQEFARGLIDLYDSTKRRPANSQDWSITIIEKTFPKKNRVSLPVRPKPVPPPVSYKQHNRFEPRQFLSTIS